ncbi:MAG: TolC family protein, partial [Gammaproteobacteria bacterium]|nr:TolC family protein [Gammaproteobacteria bacterium]
MHSRAVFWPVAVVLSLSACATYTALPLPRQPNLAVSAAALTVPASEFATPGVQATRIDLSKPLDASAVAALAVLNNPQLTALRDQLGVAAAQSYAAGLLPWPELTAGRGRPSSTGPGIVDPWQLALTEDAAALIQHHEIERAGQASRRRVNLSVIWDEWQVAQEARILFADLEAQQSELNAMQPLVALYADHARNARSDSNTGSVSQASIEAALAAYDALLASQNAIEIKRLKDMSDLKALLGLAPDVSLSLALDQHPRPVKAADLNMALADLPHRRPDLMALAAAYETA